MEILDNKQLTEKLGAISEFLNDKCDLDLHNTQPLARTVVEVSDPSLMPSWYRVYSDGWCEQGGYATGGNLITVNLLKNYNNTDYTITLGVTLVENYAQTYAEQLGGWIKPSKKLTNEFGIIKVNWDTATCYWQASGYIR